MILSDTANKNGIIQTCELLLDTGDGGISGSPTLLLQFINLANRAYENVVSMVMKYEGDYTWDDSNYTTFPVGYVNLGTTPGSEQSDYVLPAANVGNGQGSSNVNSFLRFVKAQILDAGGHYQNLVAISETMFEGAMATTFTPAGFPMYYQLTASSIVLYPPPAASQVTAASGLKIFFQRNKVDFSQSSLAASPGFPEVYHYLLPLEMSEAYAAIKGMKQLPFIQAKRAEFMANLGWGISNRNKDVRQRIQPVQMRRNRFYE